MDDRHTVIKILHDCISNSVGFRIMETNMSWDKQETRPLVFKDRKTGGLRDNIADCENSRILFNYKPNFKNKRKRTIIIIDI